ncbi:MAG: sensor histidine kinase [Eubacterium sp.]|nr:sensor histidine kinase [Eubacterium sp.]
MILVAALVPVLILLPHLAAVILSAGVAVSLFVLLVYDRRMLYRPLLRIRKGLEEERVEEVLQEIRLDEEGEEVGNIFQDVISYYTAKQDVEIYSRQVELAALQSQINPHFLYNTLDAIRGQAIQDNNREVAMMIQTLSAFFRYSISRKGNAVTLRDELDNVQNYMKIQQYRFEDRFRLDMEIEDPEVYDYYVPRLILQPIVENAIQHGLENIREGGLITIDVEETDDLIIMISDNGRGMTLQELDELNGRILAEKAEKKEAPSSEKHKGIALANVQKRIELFFGVPYGLHVYSSIGQGTDVEITLPIIRQEEEMSVE